MKWAVINIFAMDACQKMMTNYGYKHNGVDLGEFPNYHLERLISIGLFENHNRLGGTIFLSGGDSSVEQEVNKDVDITEIGVKYSKYDLEV